MSGTRLGGIQAAATNKQRYGENFYRLIGTRGGTISRGGGFAVNQALAVEAGRRGGSIPRQEYEAVRATVIALHSQGLSVKDIAAKVDRCEGSVYHVLRVERQKENK